MPHRQSEEYTEVKCDDIKHETDNAVLIVYQGEDKWLPLSQVSRISRYAANPSLWVKTWLAKKEGLID